MKGIVSPFVKLLSFHFLIHLISNKAATVNAFLIHTHAKIIQSESKSNNL